MRILRHTPWMFRELLSQALPITRKNNFACKLDVDEWSAAKYKIMVSPAYRPLQPTKSVIATPWRNSSLQETENERITREKCASFTEYNQREQVP